jgi:hypothetical protein
MALTTAQAFTEFAGKLVPTPKQNLTIASRRRTIESRLLNAFPSNCDLPILEVRTIGSVDCQTIIRPLHDVDLLAVFKGGVSTFAVRFFGSRQFITTVRDTLNDSSAAIVGTRGQAVRIFYAEPPWVDVAPVFPRPAGGFVLPDGHNGWLATNPDFHKQWIDRENARLDYQLKALARLMKRWNRAHGERLSSFHIEVMVASTFNSLNTNHRQAAAMFFEHGPRRLHSSDPAGHSGDLARKLSPSKQQAILQSFESARQRSSRALDAERRSDHAEAIRLWAIIFGDDFPRYG